MSTVLAPVATLPVTQWRDVIHMEAGVQLAVAGWIPDHPKAIALVSHGHAEHLGRYGHVITALVAEGFAVYGIDHRGHGRSTGTRALIEDIDRVARDLHVLSLFARDRHRGLPTVLIGHSMGGLIALRYTLLHQQVLAGLVTSGPALVIDHESSRMEVAGGKLLAAFAPGAPLARGSSSRCGLSTDPEICEQARIDHRNWNGPTCVGSAVAMLRAAEDTRQRLGEITLPLLAMHGADDHITHPRGTGLIDERVASVDKTVIFWEGMRHEVFNEVGRAEVLATLRSWLAERFG